MGQYYQCKTQKFTGRNYHAIFIQAEKHYRLLKKRTRRRLYIRSLYFDKEKIFIDTFWNHLWQKNWRDRGRRMQYFSCAIELLEKNRFDPTSIQNPNTKKEILHRFFGETSNKEIFIVQIKEDIRTGKKSLISVFPSHHKARNK